MVVPAISRPVRRRSGQRVGACSLDNSFERRLAVGRWRLREGGPRKFPDWQASYVDGAGGQSVTQRMWDRMTPVADGAVTVSLGEVREAMRLMADKARVIAEGAGALALAAALSGRAGEGPFVCIVSGGNIDLKSFAELVI